MFLCFYILNIWFVSFELFLSLKNNNKLFDMFYMHHHSKPIITLVTHIKICRSNSNVDWFLRNLDYLDNVMYQFGQVQSGYEWAIKRKYFFWERCTSRRSLSLFIFTLCAEAFVSLLNQVENQEKITRDAHYTRESSVSHFFFADDNLFFFNLKKRSDESS